MLRLPLLRSLFLCAVQIVLSPQVQRGIIRYDDEASMFALLSGILLYFAWTAPAGRRVITSLCAGLVAGLSLWGKQDIGAGAILAGVAALVFYPARAADGLKIKTLTAYVAGTILVTAAFLSYFAWHGVLAETVHALSTRGFRALDCAVPGRGGVLLGPV